MVAEYFQKEEDFDEERDSLTFVDPATDLELPIQLQIKEGDNVIVPDPEDDDVHAHSFQGTVVGFRNGYAQVQDQEENVFEIEPDRLKIEGGNDEHL
jgi:hypothetical protein